MNRRIERKLLASRVENPPPRGLQPFFICYTKNTHKKHSALRARQDESGSVKRDKQFQIRWKNFNPSNKTHKVWKNLAPRNFMDIPWAEARLVQWNSKLMQQEKTYIRATLYQLQCHQSTDLLSGHQEHHLVKNKTITQLRCQQYKHTYPVWKCGIFSML